MSQKEISIREDFADSQGRLSGYTSYDSGQLAQLALQRHVDIRTFRYVVGTRPETMSDLDQLTMAGLDPQTMADLETEPVVVYGAEQWTAGTLAKRADRNYWYDLSLTCSTGANPTSGTLHNADDSLASVDISTGFDDNDFVTIALPAFPLASVTTGSSFVDFTSNTSADFAAGPTASVAFNSGNLVTPLGSGDTEMRFKRQYINTIDLSKVTGVRFRVQATGSCTFRAMAIRLVHKNWVYAPLDTNTQSQWVQRPVALNGSVSPSSAFPTSAVSGKPTEWPIVLRSDSPPGEADPRPIDAHVSAWFNTGSKTGSGSLAAPATTGNTYDAVSLYFREHTDVGTTQTTLNNYTQDQLEQYSMGDLEVIPGTDEIWAEVKVKWSASAAEVTVSDTYVYTPTLDADTDYLLVVDLMGIQIRVRIFELDFLGRFNQATNVFDVTVGDPSLLKRTKGRFGWWAHFCSGDAYLSNVRPRGLSFGRATSVPMSSATPVEGASLYAQYTNDRELFGGWGPSPWGGTFAQDYSKSSTGKAFKVVNQSGLGSQGLMSNAFEIDNFDETEISFSSFFPGSAQPTVGTGLDCLLYDELGNLIPLHMPPIEPDRWQRVTIKPNGDFLQTGTYHLLLIQPSAGIPATWYVDNMSISTRVVRWSARGQPGDAWGMIQPAFIPFKDAMNKDSAGVAFERGSALQVQADALRQDAVISGYKAVPRHQELGNLIWGDRLAATTATASMTLSGDGLTVTADGTGSTGAVGFIWNWGDGTSSFGPATDHTYDAPGTYYVTLTVIDANGQAVSSTQVLTIPLGIEDIMFATQNDDIETPVRTVSELGALGLNLPFTIADNIFPFATSNDMTRVAYGEPYPNDKRLTIANFDGSSPVSLDIPGSDSGRYIYAISWAWDDSKIAVLWQDGASTSDPIFLATVNPDGTGWTVESNVLGFGGNVFLSTYAWSQDQSKIYLTLESNEITFGHKVGYVAVTGSATNSVSITFDANEQDHIAVLPNNGKLIVNRGFGWEPGDPNTVTDLLLLEEDGTLSKMPFDFPVFDAALSPDGTKMVVTDNTSNLNVVDTDGTNFAILDEQLDSYDVVLGWKGVADNPYPDPPATPIPNVVGYSATDHGTNSTSFNAPVPDRTQVGDLMVAMILREEDGAGTMSTPSGWTQLTPILNYDGGNGFDQFIYYKIAASGDTPGTNVTFTSSFSTVGRTQIVSIRGIDQTTPFVEMQSLLEADVTNSTTHVVPAFSSGPGANGGLLLGYCQYLYDGGPVLVNSGTRFLYVVRDQVHSPNEEWSNIGWLDDITSTPGATTFNTDADVAHPPLVQAHCLLFNKA